MMKFRDLKADEIDVRVQGVYTGGIVLLLYKDARVDMNILDETVGAENWQDKFYESKGILFCSIGIKCGSEWIWKGDAGSESNQDAEKGNASDARKRAGVVWGIGRELYSAPFMWIKEGLYSLKNGKCKDDFKVTHVRIENKVITELVVFNESKGVECFRWKKGDKAPKPAEEKPSDKMITALISLLTAKGYTVQDVGKKYSINSLSEMTMSQYNECAKGLQKLPDLVKQDIYFNNEE